ncbi:MAG TPA: DUF4114 domain-containing protein [Candidatus Hydrogenedentes bacterium]|nr:DUF4114 domain-containing protein [Candidatus Hydrogenedentota bacterium]
MTARRLWIVGGVFLFAIGVIAGILYFPRGWVMETVDTVKEAGSDDRSITFKQEQLPRMIMDANATFNPERVAADFLGIQLDPTRLVMLQEGAVRLYFVSEAAGYHNILGYQLEGPEIRDTRLKIIFPDATAPMDLIQCADLVKATSPPYYFGKRIPDAPVLPGDYVDLGVLPAGTQLVFFIVGDGARGGNRIYTTLPQRNPDGKQHVVTFVYENSPYMLLSFEDMWDTGNRSFNDVVFCVEMDQENLELIASVKEKGRIDAILQGNERRKKIRRMIFWGTLATISVLGPPFIFLAHRTVQRARARRVFAAAKEALETNPRETLRILNQGKKHILNKKMRREWSGLEMTASKQARDAAQLAVLYENMPEVFVEDEPASLLAARAQVETDSVDTYHSLRRLWQGREAAPWDWLALEADVLIKQEKCGAAEALLEQGRFNGAQDSGRLARLGMLRARKADPNAPGLLANAVQLDARNPDVYWCQGQALEQAGHYPEACNAYQAALNAAPHNPFHRDHFAEFLVRQGDFKNALTVWRQGLEPPSIDVLWLKVLFWSRMALSQEIAWSNFPIPEGRLRPLVEFLIKLPGERFWDMEQFERLGLNRPELLARPETIWLQTLDALQQKREDTAFSLISLGQAGAQPYFEIVETALRQTLTCRRIGFCNPVLRCLRQETPPSLRHPFFQQIDLWATAQMNEGTEHFQKIVEGPALFSTLFQAAGWLEAARRLKTAG